MKQSKLNGILKNGYLLLVFLFLYLPIVVIVVFSFNTSRLNILFEGFTTQWYASVFQNTILMESLENSLIAGVASTIIATVIGTLGALAMHKYQFPGKSLLDKVVYIPMVIPEVVLGIALLSVFSLIGMQLSLGTLVLGHVTFCIPFVLLNVRARLAGLDSSMEEAALDLGATPIKAFFLVTLPSISPAIASGAMLSFTLSLDDVIVSFFTTGPDSTTFPLKIFSMVKTGVTPEVNALTTMIMVVLVLIIGVNALFQIRKIKKNLQ